MTTFLMVRNHTYIQFLSHTQTDVRSGVLPFGFPAAERVANNYDVLLEQQCTTCGARWREN